MHHAWMDRLACELSANSSSLKLIQVSTNWVHACMMNLMRWFECHADDGKERKERKGKMIPVSTGQVQCQILTDAGLLVQMQERMRNRGASSEHACSSKQVGEKYKSSIIRPRNKWFHECRVVPG
jgi:hypothetical protein